MSVSNVHVSVSDVCPYYRLGREQLRRCVEELVAVYQTVRDLPQQAVVDKFAKDKFLGVSQLEPPAAFVWD